MAEVKNQAVATAADQQAALVVNNSFINALTEQIREKEKYGLTFAKDYNYTNALMGAYLTLKQTTDKNGKPLLESCSKESIANSLMDMVNLNLNVQSHHGYFIAYGGKCQFQKSYFGNIAIARRYGLKSINAEIIYEGDTFKYTIEDGTKVLVSHEQDFMNIDNTKIKGAYAVAEMADGGKIMEVMNMAQIKQSWQQGYGYKEGSGTHAKFPDQMAKKTVINRLCKMITNTYGDAAVVDTYERMDEAEPVNIIEADVLQDIDQNANKTELVVDEAPQIEEKPQQMTMDMMTGKKQKEAARTAAKPDWA